MPPAPVPNASPPAAPTDGGVAAAEPLQNSRLLRVGGRPVLVSMPNGRQYGHQAVEMALAHADARRRGIPLHFVRPPVIANRALFDLVPAGVAILDPGPLTALRLAAEMRVGSQGSLRKSLRRRRHLLDKQLKRDFHAEVIRKLANPALTTPMRQRLKALDGAFRESMSAGVTTVEEKRYYYHRRLLREPVPVSLREEAHERAVALARAAGIDPDVRPIVTMHMREAGYKLGNELQDTKPGKKRDDSVRNVRVEAYFDTVDFLVERGYTVVRIGDPTMVPLRRNGVIDLATSPHADKLLEVYCLWRSKFVLGCDSGPAYVCYLTGTPVLLANCTAPIACYPIRADGMYLLKSMTRRATGQRLSLLEMASSETLLNFRDTSMFAFHDNAPDELVEAASEMLDLLDLPRELSAVQERFREQVLAADQELRPVANYISKWGSDRGFIGDGRIAGFFAERYC